ncbi:hypothetical protein AGMMS49545_12410 [Betaproteobacteria bacterium]|nr:hypothetical protein AGMMS49545_12410 [Betaproteobacteria bacterium]GHU47193.1 hypothetical protein AGMMS50289_22010 [Betaproteobacteria bacterium]
MTAAHHYARPLVYLSLLLCAACETFPALPEATKEPAAVPRAAPDHAQPASPPAAAEVVTPMPVSNTAAPEAVYMLDADKTAPLPDSVEQSLQAIAERMKARRDLVIRLEGYVPNSGSREMNIGLSRQAVTTIRRRLVELGVPSYRVKQSPLGAEHPDSVRLDQRRVELFLLPLPR